MTSKIGLLYFLAVALALPAFSQTFGEITGVVSDSSGAVVVDAKITVTNPQTGFARETITNNTGNYTFPNLLPGLYNVRAERQSFQSGVRNSIELQVQQTARIDFRLNVGSVTETVEVLGGAPLLNTENATIGTVIEQKRIEDLPLNGRSFIALVSLAPNVSTGYTANSGVPATRSGGDRGAVSLAVAGQRREYTYFTLDGISNTDVDFNTYAFLPSIDALQEFKVQTGIYSAEFGRGIAQVNISTKSGTNAYHGAVFEFLRNNKLDARPYAFSSDTPGTAPFKWNQYGFVLGGPVEIPKLFSGKNRLFFMSNYEGFKLRNQVQQVFSVPSLAMRTGNFSEILPAAVRDPLNKDLPFPGNIIPQQRLNRIALGLLEFLPAPNIPGTGLVNNHLSLQNNTTDKNQFTQRIDFVENAKSAWYGRYSWQDESVVAPVAGFTGTSLTSNIKQVTISNTRIVTPNLVNELHFGYMGFHNYLLNELAYKRDVIKELNIPLYFNPPPIGWGYPYITIQGFSNLGDSRQAPFAADDHTFQWVDGVSWTHGTHSIRFGAEIRRDRYNQQGNQRARGSFTFQNQATGYGFGDYMLGYAAETSDAGGLAVSQLRATSQVYYVTDNWKVRPNLTIEAGLRYEFTPAWSSKGDSYETLIMPQNILTPNAPAAQSPYLARDCAAYGQSDFNHPGSIVRFSTAIPTKCVSNLGTTLVRNDRRNWAPRLGIAWSPSPKLTVRAGAGMFYAQDAGNTFFDSSRNSRGIAGDFANFTAHNLTFDQPFTAVTGPSPCGVPTPPFICINVPVFFFTDPNRRTPYVEQYELNIQRQLSASTVLEIGYFGSQGHRLQRVISVNVAVPGAGSVASRTPFPALGTANEFIGLAKSNYHSGTAKLTRRLSNGFSALLSYTFSKSLDNGSALGTENGANSRSPQNSACLRCEYGLSDFNATHRGVASMLYELPVGKGKRFLNRGVASRILSDWQVNSIVSESTGFPLNIVSGVNQSGSSVNADRPNTVYGVPGNLADPTPNRWFDIQSFVLPSFGSFGNIGRNTIIGPRIFGWDFSVLKRFAFTEGRYLQFRFECFNCGNHPRFADPGTSLAANRRTAAGIAIPGTGVFGRITSLRPGLSMRELQFSLKLIF